MVSAIRLWLILNALRLAAAGGMGRAFDAGVRRLLPRRARDRARAWPIRNDLKDVSDAPKDERVDGHRNEGRHFENDSARHGGSDQARERRNERPRDPIYESGKATVWIGGNQFQHEAQPQQNLQ